ncbi:MAG: O-antigen ligase family protein [Ktedonobacteraceae bacterium]
MVDMLLSGTYLKERGKTFFLISTVTTFSLVVLIMLIGWRLNNVVLQISAVLSSLLLMAWAIAFRQDEAAAVLCIAVHLYVDWYLGARVLALGLVMALLLVLYLTRSPQRPWLFPRAGVLWCLLLGLAIFPALRGYTLPDGMTYYLTIFFAPLLTFWLGSLLAQDMTRVRRLFMLLAALGALLAIVSLTQAATGKLLLASTRFDQYLAQVADFQLSPGGSIYRTGTFFTNPDSNGTFFAVIVFLPLSLFFASTTRRAKILYLAEILLIILALLSTYSTGAWVAGMVALLLFLVLLGNMRLRLYVLGSIACIAIILLVFFHTQLVHQLQHIAAVGDLVDRLIAWQIALRVIKALPLTGLGLGTFAYYYRAQAFRLPGRFNPLAHPHNSFLEIAAMGGLPLLLVFLVLLFLAIWWAFRNWARADVQARMLLTGGIGAVVALTINSLGVNSWTLAPLAALGWLILGALASPLLTDTFSRVTKPGVVSIGREEYVHMASQAVTNQTAFPEDISPLEASSSADQGTMLEDPDQTEKRKVITGAEARVYEQKQTS